MLWKLFVPCAAVVPLICWPVMAQTVPLLSGKYATTYNEICQAGTSTPSYSAGATYNQILIADFDNATKTVQLTGTSVSGALVVLNGVPGKLTQTSVNTRTPYSDTASTITIGRDTFNALYGPLISAMPQWLIFGGITNDGCSASAVAIRQSVISVPPPAR
jgi:hypothetical protein